MDFTSPNDLSEALHAKAAAPSAQFLSGGTDMMVGSTWPMIAPRESSACDVSTRSAISMIVGLALVSPGHGWRRMVVVLSPSLRARSARRRSGLLERLVETSVRPVRRVMACPGSPRLMLPLRSPRQNAESALSRGTTSLSASNEPHLLTTR